MRTPAPSKAFLLTACLLCAVAAFGLALWTYTDVSMFGFPDGYLTEYQRAARTPLTVTAWTGVALGLLFSVLGFWPYDLRVRTIAWSVAFVALVLVAATGVLGIPWYLGTHLGLDNGIGG